MDCVNKYLTWGVSTDKPRGAAQHHNCRLSLPGVSVRNCVNVKQVSKTQRYDVKFCRKRLRESRQPTKRGACLFCMLWKSRERECKTIKCKHSVCPPVRQQVRSGSLPAFPHPHRETPRLGALQQITPSGRQQDSEREVIHTIFINVTQKMFEWNLVCGCDILCEGIRSTSGTRHCSSAFIMQQLGPRWHAGCQCAKKVVLLHTKRSCKQWRERRK